MRLSADERSGGDATLTEKVVKRTGEDRKQEEVAILIAETCFID